MATELNDLRDALVRAMGSSPDVAERVAVVMERSGLSGTVDLTFLESLRQHHPQEFAAVQAVVAEHASEFPPSGTAPHVAGDHVEFRDGTFHGQVVGVQNVRNTYETRPGIPQPMLEDWLLGKDVESLAYGVRPSPRTKGHPPMPPYAERDADGAVTEVLKEAGAEGGFVIVLGEAYAGKTRTALHGLAEELPDAKVFTPVSGENLRTLPAALRGSEKPHVVWLDDLDHHFGDGGVEPRLLAQLTAQGAVVLATLREEGYETYRRTSPHSRILELAHIVDLPRKWSAAERGRAERSGDPRLVEAAGYCGAEGVAAYLTVSRQLREEWQRARSASRHPRGYAVVRAAIDLARCGLRGALSEDLLATVHERYGIADMERESFSGALEWAAQKRHGILPMLRSAGSRAWEVVPCLVHAGEQDDRSTPIDMQVGRLALDAARADPAYDFEAVVIAVDKVFRYAALAGDSTALYELGLLAEGQGDTGSAELWFEWAARAGRSEAAGRLGRLLLARGEEKAAEHFLEAAGESGDAEAAVILGTLLRERAVRWLKAGADRGNAEAQHLLGDLLLGAGNLGEAGDYYMEAARARRAEVAGSMGAFHLLVNEGEAAKVWLKRAADTGDRRAARQLAVIEGQPQSPAEAEEYFEDTEGYPLDIANYGVLLEGQKRLKEACEQYLTAYRSGDAYGAYRVAQVLEEIGTASQAADWYRKAADMGHPDAKQALAENPDTVRE